MPTSEEIERIRGELASWSWERRESMLDYVRALPHEERVALLVGLYTVNKQRRRIRNWREVALTGAVLAFAYFAFRMIEWHNHGRGAGVMVLASVFINLATQAFTKANRRLTPRAAERLLPLTPDKRLVAPLLQSLHDLNYSDYSALAFALTKSLPLLDIESYATLSRVERSQLIKLLSDDAPDRQKTVLNALSLGEETSAIPQVEQLLKRTGHADVTRAAEACLSRLYEAREAQKLGAALLRPSQADAVPETLLRPVSSIQGEQEQQLLRPHE